MAKTTTRQLAKVLRGSRQAAAEARRKAKPALDPRRKEGVSATDVAVIAGLVPKKSAWDLYMTKTGQVEPDFEAVQFGPTYWGNILEPYLVNCFSQANGVKVKACGTIWSKEVPWACATPDGLVDPNGTLEAKTMGLWASIQEETQWGDPGTDQVPAKYAAQGQWQLMVTGRRVCYMPRLVGGNVYAEYVIRRDDEVIEMLRELAERFWNHLRTKTEPPRGHSASAEEWVKRTYPRHVKPPVHAEELDNRLAKGLAWRKAIREWAEQEEAAYKLDLKARIGDAEGIVGDGWKATWKATKDTERVNWNRLAQAIREAHDVSDDEWNRLVIEHTETAPGVRRFLLTYPNSLFETERAAFVRDPGAVLGRLEKGEL